MSNTGESSIFVASTTRQASNTQDLDVAMNKSFEYPTILSQTQLRLLEILPKEPTGKIEGRYHIVSLDYLNDANYTALSYTWDEANTPEDVREIQVNNQTFFIRINLHNFLDYASRRLAGRFIYVDAICIDQSDSTEKGHQVRMMTTIYSEASEVMVWLGLADPDPEIRAGLASLNSKSSWASNDLNPNKDEEKALDFICSRPYWERVWIIQETLLATRLILLCGEYSYLWSSVLDLQPHTSETQDAWIDRFGKFSFDTITLSGRGTTATHAPFLRILEYQAKWASRVGMTSHSLDSFDGYVRGGNRQSTKIPLYIALSAFWTHKCTDPRDKLYGILGLIEDDIRADIQPDYTLSVNQVYRIALECGFRSINAQISDMTKQPPAIDFLTEVALNQIKLVEPMPRLPGSSGLMNKYVFSRTPETLSRLILRPSEFSQHSGVTGLDYMHNLLEAHRNLAQSLHKSFHLPLAEIQETRAKAISHLLSKQRLEPLTMKISGSRSGITLVFDSMAKIPGLVELMEYNNCCKEQNQALPIAENFAPHVSGTDTRFAYHFIVLQRYNGDTLERIAIRDLLIENEVKLGDPRLLTKFTPALLYLPGERTLDSYRSTYYVDGPTGVYFTQPLEVRMFEGSGPNKRYVAGPTPAQLKELFESKEHMPIMQQAMASQLSSHKVKHNAWCNGCREQIKAVRYCCRDCVDYDLCCRCHKEAARTHSGHHLEPVYSPDSVLDLSVKPGEYLQENFGAIAYRFHGTVMDNIMQDFTNDPDSQTAFRTSYSFGVIFPWIPRMGIDPPYWVGNLDCNFQPAASQVPHIRCMGLRLKSSDPVDAPPNHRPAGYRFTGQPLLGAIGEAQHALDDTYGPNALVCPLPELAERAALAWALYLSTAVEDSEGKVQARSLFLPLRFRLPCGVDKEDKPGENAELAGTWGLKMPFGEFEDYIEALPIFSLLQRSEERAENEK